VWCRVLLLLFAEKFGIVVIVCCLIPPLRDEIWVHCTPTGVDTSLDAYGAYTNYKCSLLLLLCMLLPPGLHLLLQVVSSRSGPRSKVSLAATCRHLGARMRQHGGVEGAA